MKNATSVLRKLRKPLRRLFRVALLPVFALALVAAMWVAAVVQTRLEFQSSRADAVAQSQALARVLSEHVTYILRQADHATHLYKLKYEERGSGHPLSEFSRRNGLLDSVLPVRLDLPMAVIDAYGKPVDSANGFAPDNLAGAPFFQQLAQNSSDTVVFSTPVTGGDATRWHIQAARRLNDSTGQFAGAFIIQVDPHLFVDDYDRLDVRDNGALLLMSHAGGLTVGRAGDTLFASDRLSFKRMRAPGASSEELIPNTPLDAVERIYSYRDLPRYGLSAVVGVETGAAMAKFERHRTQYLGLATIATVLIITIVIILMRQSAQLVASVRAGNSARATLRAASEGSLDGVMILKAVRNAGGDVADFAIVDLNQRCAALFGRQRADLLGKHAFATMPRYRQTGFFERYVAVYLQGGSIEEDVELRLEGDAPRWIRHQIVPLDDGVAVTARDITARKNAEIEMHSNRIFLQSLIDHLPVLICVKSLRQVSFGAVMVWNKAAEKMTGLSASDVVGQVDSDAFPAGFALANRAQDLAMLSQPAVMDVPDLPLQLADGGRRYLHAVSVPLYDDDGRPEFVLCIAEDVTLRREQEQSLRTNEAHLTAMTNASPLGIVRTDVHGNCTYVNQRFETITGLTAAQSLGMGWLSVFDSEESGYFPDVFRQQRASAEPFSRITRCTRIDGVRIWASTKIAAIRINGRIEGFVGTIDDITTLREAELALRESEARLRTIADTMPTMISYIDANQVYRFHNRAYNQEFVRNSARSTMVGSTVLDAIGPERYRTLEPFILRALAGETLTYEEQDDSNGIERVFEVTYIPQVSDDGTSVIGFHTMRRDITSQRRETRQLRRLAQIDALTGLANRAGFMQKLGAAMDSAAAEGRLMALMYMDIDRFKPVNDTHGHHIGDELLRALSARLLATLRATDTVSRLGGDEFTIILENLARAEDACLLAEKIVTAMQAPFALEGITVSISVSIGLAYFKEGKVEPDVLIREADRLLYLTKERGRNGYQAAAPLPAGL